MIDLHMHSTASDGTDSPAALIAACKEQGITHAVLTDHDTIAGVSEFLTEAEKAGITAVTGIEFSAAYDGELHILVYGADIQNREYCDMIEQMQNSRKNRIHAMTQKLMDGGYAISHEAVARFAAGGVPGRPHIAQALVEAGYAEDITQAFGRYLNAGCPGFVERFKLTQEQILAMAKKAGGIAVLAHPKLIFHPDIEGLVAQLSDLGLQGLEAFYPEHSNEECAYFCKLAQQYGLFVTQGSDHHGGMRSTTWLGKEQRGQDHPLLQAGVRTIFEKSRG